MWPFRSKPNLLAEIEDFLLLALEDLEKHGEDGVIMARGSLYSALLALRRR